MASKIQLRRDLAANWTSNNPTLSTGEAGYETDTNYLKIGDGATAWTDLEYVVGVDTNATYTITYVDSGEDAILRLTGTNSTTDDLTFVAGTNIELTPTGDNLTIATAATLTGDLTGDVTSTGTSSFGTISTTGDATIGGDLTVNGTTTTVNTSELLVEDANITVANGAADAAAANGAGLTVDGASATFTYTSADDRWNLNKDLNVANVYGDLTGDVTGSVYATDTTLLVDAATATIPTANLSGALPVLDGSALTGLIADIVNDTTPQLGANLDVNGNDIFGTGNIELTGNITLTGGISATADISAVNITATGSATADSFVATAGGDANIVFSDTRSLFIKEGATIHVTVDSSGRVGIGKTPTQGLLDVDGDAYATAFFGPLTGNVTGDVTGNVTGDVTGDVTGNVTGNLTGDVTGNITGNVTGNVTGEAGTVPWSGVTSTPTTLGGYGITDAATSAQGALADSALQSVAFSDLTSTPTTLQGYGITDASSVDSINDLSDVNANATNGDILQYDGNNWVESIIFNAEMSFNSGFTTSLPIGYRVPNAIDDITTAEGDAVTFANGINNASGKFFVDRIGGDFIANFTGIDINTNRYQEFKIIVNNNYTPRGDDIIVQGSRSDPNYTFPLDYKIVTGDGTEYTFTSADGDANYFTGITALAIPGLSIASWTGPNNDPLNGVQITYTPQYVGDTIELVDSGVNPSGWDHLGMTEKAYDLDDNLKGCPGVKITGIQNSGVDYDITWIDGVGPTGATGRYDIYDIWFIRAGSDDRQWYGKHSNTTSLNLQSFNGDLTGNVLADDSTIMVNAQSGVVTAPVVGDLTGSVFADNSTLLVDAVNGNLTYVPTTPADWDGTAPATVGEALDRLATLVKTLNGGTGA